MQACTLLWPMSNIHESTTEILKATHELGGKQVKRFVLLGSAVSILDSFEDLNAPEGKPHTEDDWNPVRFPALTI